MRNGNYLNIFKLAGLIVFLTLSANASAVFVDLTSSHTQLNGHSVTNVLMGGQPIVTESGPMELDFTAGLRNSAPLVLDVMIEAGDRRPYIAFSANFINLSSAPLNVLILELGGAATFDNAVNLSASGLIQQDPTRQIVTITLDSSIAHGTSLSLGRPDQMPSFDDWLIELNNMSAGDRFSLTIWNGERAQSVITSVPEPTSICLVLFALAIFTAQLRFSKRFCHLSA